jgi:hypothetical protein
MRTKSKVCNLSQLPVLDRKHRTLMINRIAGLDRKLRHEVSLHILQCILIFGDFERFPFGLERCLRILGHCHCRSGHLVLHGLGLVRGCRWIEKSENEI